MNKTLSEEVSDGIKEQSGLDEGKLSPSAIDNIIGEYKDITVDLNPEFINNIKKIVEDIIGLDDKQQKKLYATIDKILDKAISEGEKVLKSELKKINT